MELTSKTNLEGRCIFEEDNKKVDSCGYYMENNKCIYADSPSKICCKWSNMSSHVITSSAGTISGEEAYKQMLKTMPDIRIKS